MSYTCAYLIQNVEILNCQLKTLVKVNTELF